MKKNLFLSMCLFISMGVNAQITFDKQDTITTHASGATKVVAADIDGDGILDAITADSLSDGTSGKLLWFKNNNDGTKKFAVTDTIALGVFGTVAAGDIDGDGTTDIATIFMEGTNGILRWYKNEGTGIFTLGKSIKAYYSQAQPIVSEIRIIDIDNDNDNDIVISNYTSNILEWFENTSQDGTSWTEHTIGNIQAVDFSISDIDQDGKLDLVAADNDVLNTRFRVIWYKNNGNASSWTPNIFNDITVPLSCVYTSDLNNDNIEDIVFGIEQSSSDSARIVWYENSAGGPLLTQSYKKIYAIATSDFPISSYKFTDVRAADLDLDGDQDLVFSSDDNYVRTIRNNGSGTFAEIKNVTNTVDQPVSIYTADLDSVQDIDLLVASQNDNTIAYYNNITPIFLQDPQDAAPVCVGTDSVLFTVKTINAAYPPRWQEGSADISTSDSHYHGVETDSLYVNAWYANMNGYKYRCRIIGADPGYPKDTSEFAVMTVDQNVQADAGSDKNLCEANDFQLQGNDPSPNKGNWTSNATTASFTDASIYNTTAQNFGTGVIEMYWSIDNKSCGISKDTMIIKNYQNISANAGTDTEICDTSKYQLKANNPASPSIGTWSANKSEVSFDDVNAWNAIASNLPAGISPTTTFTWELNNVACGSSYDQVVVSHYETIIADAGADKSVCNQTVGSIEANDPSPQGTGYWTSTDPNVIIELSNSYATNLSNISHGTYTYTWTVENHVCGSYSDDMVLSSHTRVSIDQQPSDITVTEGEDANFKIKVSGDVLSYQWYKGDNPLSNDSRIDGSATDSLLINNTQVSDSGAYKCIFVDECFTNDNNSNIVQLTVNVSTTGFADLTLAGFKVYPNPNGGVFHIENKEGQLMDVQLMDLKGEIVFQKHNINTKSLFVDMSSYPKGVYILEIKGNKKVVKSKVIIQ